jgi:pimeloyl-ACP methyl ester carboxylesterase
MMNAPSLPTDDPAAVTADFERRARRFETPCGDGVMVWRAWGSGPPLLLLHGSHGSWSHWIRNIDALAASGRTVWAADLPGFGESDMPPAAEPRPIADVLAAGVRQLIGEAPVEIVGFSFGGVAGAYLAEFHPELVQRLILVGCGGLDTPMGHVQLRGVRRHEGEARRAAHRDNLLGLMLHDPASVDDLAIHLQELNGLRGRLNPGALVLPDRLVATLPRVAAQVDAIWGAYDRPHPDPAAQEAVLRRLDPDVDFRVIEDAGHWAMYERPAEFDRAVLDMLSRPLRRT